MRTVPTRDGENRAGGRDIIRDAARGLLGHHAAARLTAKQRAQLWRIGFGHEHATAADAFVVNSAAERIGGGA